MQKRGYRKCVGSTFSRRHHCSVDGTGFHPDPDRIVDTFVHPQCRLRNLAKYKFCERCRNQALEGERHRQVELTRPTLTDVVSKDLQITQYRTSPIDQHLSRIGKPNSLRRPYQQSGAHLMLQQRKPAGKRRLGHPEVGGGFIDASQLYDPQKVLDMAAFHGTKSEMVMRIFYNTSKVSPSFLKRKAGRPYAISAYGDPVVRALRHAGIYLQPEGPNGPLGKGSAVAGQ